MSLAGLIQMRGEAVTFTLETQSQDNTTGHTTPTQTTVVGHSLQVAGEAREYEQLGLVGKDARTLEFTPITAGEEPALGSTVSLGGATYTTKRVYPVAPAGVSQTARVIVAR